ncbi:MAG: tail fiber protein [Alphaproteobacteria bacterium]
MNLSTTQSATTFAGDGATVNFPTGFKFLENSHVQVVLRDSAASETTWTENTEYTLTGAGIEAGGTITVNIAPANYTPLVGEYLTIQRVVPETQGTDFPEGGAFPATAHEQALDLLTMMVQQHWGELSRSLVAPVTDPSSSHGKLPASNLRADKFLAFDGDGKPIASSGPLGGSSIPVSSYMETVLDDTSAANARTTLGAQIALNVPSQAEAEGGIATDERIWTAERVKQAIVALAPIPPIPDAIPTGVMLDFASSGAVPSGYLLCDGSSVSRTTYADLLAAIATTWGVSDGSTTFDLPDSRRRVAVGAGGKGTGTLGNTLGDIGGSETLTLTVAEMPVHSHIITTYNISSSGQAQGGPDGGQISTNTEDSGSNQSHNNV